ncbi:MAG: Arm DNA-binding domain-containing protein [Burkholderiaceae bacterium]|nr:Arm DNA-binding domain-containing protein [Burkholderiaceae bacterium]
MEVIPSGSKTWRFKYHLNGKREKVTIGAYPAFTIKQARDRHEELRALIERGQSPAKAKRALSTEQKLADARRLSFRTFAQRWVDETLFYRSRDYVVQTVRWLDACVYRRLATCNSKRFSRATCWPSSRRAPTPR